MKIPELVQHRRIDLGLTHFLITSDGDEIENACHLRWSERLLKRKQRALSRKQRGSNRRRKARMELARLHERAANQRRDFHHKVAGWLVDLYDVVGHENLNMKGGVKNRYLARSIANAGWYGLLAIGGSKAECAGKCWIGVSPNGTSKSCTGCRCIMDAMPLSMRVSTCPGHDGDVNATINMKTRAGTALHGAALLAMNCEARKSVGGAGLEGPSVTGG